MDFTTKTDILPLQQKLTYKNKILITGSCFANEVGNMLRIHGFNTMVNPFGTLYNPVSIAQSIERLESGVPFEYDEVIDISLHSIAQPLSQAAESHKYCSFSHHSSFAKDTPQDFLAEANNRLAEQALFFKGCDTVIITLGTSWIFRHLQRDMVVSNCHKIAPKEFRREFLMHNATFGILNNLIIKYPHKNFIFTVSPIRHLKDGAHGNNISKASLLLAVENIIAQHPNNTYYFPAYEIMLDELRDYRFYAEDMVHPSDVAVKYIFEKFKENCIDPAGYSKMQQMFKSYRQNMHRPLM